MFLIKIGVLISILMPQFLQAAEIRSSFDQEVAKCVATTKAEGRKCSDAKCPWLLQAQPCLEKIGLKKDNCTFEKSVLICSPEVTNSLFPQTNSCQLRVRLHDNGDINSGFKRIDQQTKACLIHGYEIKNDFADIALTQRQMDGSWLLPKPVLALSLDKHIKPSDIIADSITFEDVAKHSGWDCREEDLEHMENQEVYREHFDIKKELNPIPQRHFVGRNGPKQFLRISSFVLKNDIKICSVIIPKDTLLSISDSFTCGALIDGAVDLEHIPRRIFPASKLSTKVSKDTDETRCMPIPRKFNHIENFKASPSFAPFPKIPNIDWNNCDCDSPRRQFD